MLKRRTAGARISVSSLQYNGSDISVIGDIGDISFNSLHNTKVVFIFLEELKRLYKLLLLQNHYCQAPGPGL